MKRRSFLKAGALSTTPLFIKGVPVFGAPSTGSSALNALAAASYGCGKILVIVQMNGGNDALNMIFPVDKWANLVNARANILIDQSQVLPLTGNSTTGLHPSMPEMQQMYNDGKMMIVQGVSYPNPNFSHFRATDIWFSASDSTTVLETGWLGRELDTQYPGFPTGYPNANYSDPLAIQIGSTLPFSLQGPNINMGYNVANPNALLNVINGITDPAPNNDYGRELSFLRLMKDQSNAYKDVIQNAYNVSQPATATYPTGNALADQLKIVAKLINGGLQTPIFIVNHPNSHDTHSAQVNSADKATGTHPNILATLSKAIGAFQQDLQLMGKADKVSGMTYSEFGRRIKSNASIGTDHGAAAPVMFFGAALNTNPATVAGTSYPVPGMIGSSPNLPLNTSVNDQVPMQFDFRQLYATVMQDWLCLSAAQTDAVLGSAFSRLPIFNTATVLPLNQIELSGQYIQGQSSLVYHVQQNGQYAKFTIQFSGDGNQFSDIHTQPNTSLNDVEFYNYQHSISNSKMWYRVAAVTHQGETILSNIILLRNRAQNQLMSVYPNPVTNQKINIQFFESVNGQVDITIYNDLGQKMYYNRFTQVSTTLSFSVPVMVADVHYILEARFGNEISREQILFR